ncbi:hypothetical protein ACGF0J_21985 [Nonomuraea sp. NPDC047897]|uniref:hypothetical protein n=1 Tax=Nonomuraea sp. NPDC047897 TaxID=3364346 RepID=UPI0037214846
MPVMEGTRGLKVAVGEYDHAVDGGTVGTKVLRSAPGDSNGNEIPAGSVILGGYIEVDTAVLSATGTVAVQAQAAADVLAATGQAGLTVGRKDVIPAWTGSTSLKTTAVRNITIVVATAVLTAGKFRVVLFYR